MVSTHSASNGFIAGLIAWSAHNPVIIFFFAAAGCFWGYRSLLGAPLDAIPDLSDVQVIVYTDWPGHSPDLIEDQITYPLSTMLLAAPKVRTVRGQSVMGASFVYAIFEDGTDVYWARSRVVEYLNTLQSKLPEGVRPTLGPDASGVGWVYQYALVDKSGRHDLAELRSLQDFTLRYWLESLEGVAEVASVGGFEKEYQVAVDPIRLSLLDISLNDMARAIRRSNSDVGGRVLEIAGHEHIIRGRGYIRTLADIRQIVLKAGRKGIPITVGDVAEVSPGPALRRGLADLDGERETVGGIVVMRYGDNALDVIERVEERLTEIRPMLPAGVEIVSVYDRSSLIRGAIDTLRTTLTEEMVAVSLVVVLFLLHLRSALVVMVTLPVAILLAFLPITAQHLTANIMSLGGIAVAVGAMVDAAIVIVENVHKRLELAAAENGTADRSPVIIAAMQEVGPSIFFSLLVITVSFLPVFALEGTEGRLFRPLAYTKSYVMGFAALLAVTMTPALAMILIRGRIRGDDNPFNRRLVAMYVPVVRFAVRFRWGVIGAAILGVLATVPVFRQIGNEFMPPLNEGVLLYMPTTLPGISITEAGRVLQLMIES